MNRVCGGPVVGVWSENALLRAIEPVRSPFSSIPVSGSYDVDRHVRQVLERQQRRPQRVVNDEQLALFEIAQARLRPPPMPQMTAGGLVVGEDMLFARKVCLHSATKASAARAYADIER